MHAHLEQSQSPGARGDLPAAPACKTQHLVPGCVVFSVLVFFFFFKFNKLLSSLVRQIPTVPK